MNSKIKLSIVFVFVAFSTWFYFTPHLSVSGMKSAAEAKNSAKLSGYVNFPSLRESLKASFSAKFAPDLEKMKNDKPFAGFGAAMANALINPLIDALVTPENLGMMVNGYKPHSVKESEKTKPTDTDADISMAYESLDRFVVTVRKTGAPKDVFGLVFHRDGLFSWKLSALRM